MSVTVLDCGELADVVRREVQAALRERERPRDAAGRVLLTKKEAAEVMGASEATIDRWRETRGLPFVKLDDGTGKGKVWFRVETLNQWASANELTLSSGG